MASTSYVLELRVWGGLYSGLFGGLSHSQPDYCPAKLYISFVGVKCDYGLCNPLRLGLPYITG